MPWIDPVKEYVLNNASLLITTFISVSLAAYFYFKSNHTKNPRYALKSTNLVEDFVSKLDALEMKYAGKEINNLTITKLIFWNNGKDTIRRLDVASTDPLILKIKDEQYFLDAKIIYQKKPANRFLVSLASNKKQITMDFEYIDKNEGAIIQLLHTGRSSKDISLCGTIMGAGKIKQVAPFGSSIKNMIEALPFPGTLKSKVAPKTKKKIIASMMFLLPAIMIITDIFSSEKLTDGIGGKIGLTFITFLYWFSAVMTIRRDFPKGFEQFEERI